jgi:GGDEF domain-containing protein
VGRILRSATRATDGVGRFGGDEFGIVLPGTDAAGAQIVAHRIFAALEATSIATPAGPVPLRASLGLAVLDAVGDMPGDGPAQVTASGVAMLAETLIKRADEGLYDAKRAAKRAGTTQRAEAHA